MKSKIFPSEITENLTFVDTFSKVHSVLGEVNKDKKWVISYSGGSDSDTMMWLFRWLGYEPKGVFFDTGLEYDATKRHLEFMRKEGFDIETVRAIKSIPTTNKEYGTPFLNKNTSEMISRLQKHNFQFKEDGEKGFDELWKKYPNSKAALRWWTDGFTYRGRNISWNKNLKDFLIFNDGAGFPVANRCCDWAKKHPAKKYGKDNNIDMMCLGIRRAEGGMRVFSYKTCTYTSKASKYNMFFPLFWWSDKEKRIFDEAMNIKHSDCYEVYDMTRTGCAACPFGLDFEDTLDTLEKHEPKLHNGVTKIFSKSYALTRQYREFRKLKDEENKSA